MHWFTSFVLFVLIWWVVLFAVLPFGTRPTEATDESGGWRGAPAKPRIGRKMLITTAISIVFWAGAMSVIRSDMVSFRSGTSVTGD